VDAGFFISFELQDDGTFNSSFNTIPLDQFPDTVDFQFPAPPEVETVSGTVSLPRRVILDDDVGVSVNVLEFDASGSFIDSAFSTLTIEAGNRSVDYELDYIQPASDSELFFRFLCTSNCEPVTGDLVNNFILQDDGTFTDVINFVPVADFSDTIDFQFPPEDTVMSPILLLLLEED